jgi:molecular chaperone GrpE
MLQLFFSCSLFTTTKLGLGFQLKLQGGDPMESLEAAKASSEETLSNEAHSPETQSDKTLKHTTSLLEKLDQLVDLMQGLQSDFEHKIKYDESKERIVTRLHDQLQDCRAGHHLQLIRPLVMGLISLHDDVNKLVENSESIGPGQQKTFLSFAESIEEILIQNGVETYTLVDREFVPRQQRAVYTVPTEEPAEDRLIAKHIRKGFRYEERVLRPEIVATYKLVKPTEASEPSSNNEEESND